MVDAIRVVAIVILLTGIARADLELTPQIQEYDLDGVKLRQLAFDDGDRRVTYSPPRKWQYSGGGNRLVLHPESASSAEAVIAVIKLSRTEPFDESTTKRLCDEVLASVPRDATKVTVVSQQLNPLLIAGKETFLVIISYDYYSQSYEKSVMFLNRKNEQVRFELTSYRNTFPELEKAFESSHYSWQNL